MIIHHLYIDILNNYHILLHYNNTKLVYMLKYGLSLHILNFNIECNMVLIELVDIPNKDLYLRCINDS